MVDRIFHQTSLFIEIIDLPLDTSLFIEIIGLPLDNLFVAFHCFLCSQGSPLSWFPYGSIRWWQSGPLGCCSQYEQRHRLSEFGVPKFRSGVCTVVFAKEELNIDDGISVVAINVVVFGLPLSRATTTASEPSAAAEQQQQQQLEQQQQQQHFIHSQREKSSNVSVR